MGETIALITITVIPIFLVLIWLFYGLIIDPRTDKKVEQQSHEEFEKDWNTFM